MNSERDSEKYVVVNIHLIKKAHYVAYINENSLISKNVHLQKVTVFIFEKKCFISKFKIQGKDCYGSVFRFCLLSCHII